MAYRRGHRHQVTIDGQTVWLDSKTEFKALEQFITKYNFSGQWLRPQLGIKHVGKTYTPDFELAVDDFGRTARAIIEVKQYRKDLTKGIAKRMCITARHYHTKYIYLFTTEGKNWYKIISPNVIRKCSAPLPGKIPIAQLSKPKSLKTKNYYGRTYHQNLSDRIFSLIFR